MDFRDFGNGAPITTQERTVRWWCAKKDEVHSSVGDALTLLEPQQSGRAAQYARDARLYGNAASLRMSGLPAFQVPSAGVSFQMDRGVTYNVVQSVIDTVVSRIGKNRPKPYFLTSNGDYREQRKAKRLNAFCDGLFYEVKAHRKTVEALRDACVWGDGIIHVFMKGGRVQWERVLPFELLVDEVEGVHGAPRQMYRVKDVDRAMLIERFPDKAKLLESTPQARFDNAAQSS